MKKIFLKTAMASMLCMGFVSCADELNIKSIDPQSTPTYSVEGLLAKQYATLGLTGQKGPAGSADLSCDEGESGFIRTIFNLQELMTDETAWAYQNDPDIAPITNLSWKSSNGRVNWAYQRLIFDITLYNQFITEQSGSLSEDKIAEVRFLRALNYYYFLDLYRKAPFKLTFDDSLPTEKSGKDLYEWLDNELTTIEPLMAEVGAYNNSQNFGRADRGAAYALHARLALNSEVYTDGQVKDYQKAIDYCDKIITSGKYDLCREKKNGYSGYQQLFMGDNDCNPEAMKEIIFPIRQDGLKARAYAGTTYLVAAATIAGMPYASTGDPWKCFFARENMVEKFFPNKDIPMAAKEDIPENATQEKIIAKDNEKGISTADVVAKAKDDRALFYMGVGGCETGKVRTINPGENITGPLNGASFVKWSNLHADGTAQHDQNYSDTDFPVFRLAEIYLTRAEAKYRLNGSQEGLADILEVQGRANRDLKATSVDDQTLIDEWCREFYMEGRRRSDLVRFGLFSGSKYLWSFKGGVENGTGIPSYYDVYPIPYNEIKNNPNMTQNPKY
ncbi:starch-binding outer membrane lipoprotein SusD [Prevotella copri]|uniref:Starch-binding outer membrane lipoprotein SusD n=1 Tax=Segatella copri TaxID=165179 RepID=A0A6A7W9Q4_9BACT|nr:starch-binding outer membrane lipoprotein SusD [Segatella copri]MQP11170.1 starch-binding outer membrane lipoprotein SusD [Segatella copri]